MKRTVEKQEKIEQNFSGLNILVQFSQFLVANDSKSDL